MDLHIIVNVHLFITIAQCKHYRAIDSFPHEVTSHYFFRVLSNNGKVAVEEIFSTSVKNIIVGIQS